MMKWTTMRLRSFRARCGVVAPVLLLSALFAFVLSHTHVLYIISPSPSQVDIIDVPTTPTPLPSTTSYNLTSRVLFTDTLVTSPTKPSINVSIIESKRLQLQKEISQVIHGLEKNLQAEDSPSKTFNVTANPAVYQLRMNRTVTFTKAAYVTKNKPLRPLKNSFYTLSPEKISPYNFGNVINNPNYCQRKGSELLVIVGVITGTGNRLQRDTIRSTWGKYPGMTHVRMQTLFFMGKSTNLHLNREVYLEDKIHHDIIQDDFVDSYRNLTLKSVMLLNWVSRNCMDASYVAKIDDDMLLNPPAFLQTIAAQPRTKALFGNRIHLGVVERVGRWALTLDQYPFPKFPDYLNGNGYVMSSDIAPILFHASEHFHRIDMEDVLITGVLPMITDILIININTFPSWAEQGWYYNCKFLEHSLDGVHNVGPQEMPQVWDMLKNNRKCYAFKSRDHIK